MEEIKIIPPEGMEIDEENSTFDCIKFRPIKRWVDDKNARGLGWSISHMGTVNPLLLYLNTNSGWSFATKELAKSALAMARISQIIANDSRFGGIITDEEWKCDTMFKYFLTRRGNNIFDGCTKMSYHFLAFHTVKERELFYRENKDLVKQYFMLNNN